MGRGPDKQPRRRRGEPPVADDELFGGLPPEDDDPGIPAMSFGDQPEDPPPELEALGPPPKDAVALQKWNYEVLSTMIAIAMKDRTISNQARAKQIIQLSAAAAKHYPEASRFDLAQRLDREAEEMAGKKRARAAAKMERRPPAGAAKVIPIRSDASQG